ncbi:MAG TPA: hypothetical protein VM533_04425, partial [Fimbriiglobus sp.]|nr:hypothetical protein [Fimbriiglobus sp.]
RSRAMSEHTMGVEQNNAQNPPEQYHPPITLSDQDIAYLDKTFQYHPPKGDQSAMYGRIRSAVRSAAITVITNCPQSRERSLALTKLEEACMWANAAVARNG